MYAGQDIKTRGPRLAALRRLLTQTPPLFVAFGAVDGNNGGKPRTNKRAARCSQEGLNWGSDSVRPLGPGVRGGVFARHPLTLCSPRPYANHVSDANEREEKEDEEEEEEKGM
ncbi:hypothetical protein E2C01_096751 [Portunus trituberculatus]|uniref:Uncharacterized protein n=1 Tax=Portunus trituberculatus TaxID=210409 RepID=A0A5B7JYQ3_PORTR|nr:hypothetical protein [Portunus trituberculatus]